jgi:hypothetical protein
MREVVMKQITLVLIVVFVLSGSLYASEPGSGGFTFGALFMAGGRYDNLRMCVGSDAGVKGGPMADIQMVVKYALSREYAVAFHLPVMRPILFGIAFDMLQFEPEFTFEYRKPISEGLAFVTGPGLGVSLHYGPDYESDLDNRGDDFFAAGPYISMMMGLAFGSSSEPGSVLGIRAIYIPLFSKEYSPGTVIGAVLEYTIFF